jgi:hypothetical protein
MDHSRQEPRIGSTRDNDVPVLTEVVGPEITDDSSPYVLLDERDDPEDFRVENEVYTGFDDHFGVEEAEATGREAPNAAQQSRPADSRPVQSPAADIDGLRASLTMELNEAVAGMVEDATAGLETLLVERISARLKDEISGIVGAALVDYEREKNN